MRSLILKTAGVVVAVFMALSFLAMPSASAQTATPTSYPPVPPAVNATARLACSPVGTPDTAVSTGGVAITFEKPCFVSATVFIESTPTVIFNGAIPADGKISALFPASVTPGRHMLTINAKLADGGTYYSRFPITVPPPASVPASAAPAAAAGAAAAPLPASVAFTGSDIQLPIAIGASLVGAGGLALLAARKRSYKF